jgi:hypothetical protein
MNNRPPRDYGALKQPNSAAYPAAALLLLFELQSAAAIFRNPFGSMFSPLNPVKAIMAAISPRGRIKAALQRDLVAVMRL